MTPGHPHLLLADCRQVAHDVDGCDVARKYHDASLTLANTGLHVLQAIAHERLVLAALLDALVQLETTSKSQKFIINHIVSQKIKTDAYRYEPQNVDNSIWSQ